jgi:hypothetical protein
MSLRRSAGVDKLISGADSTDRLSSVTLIALLGSSLVG